MPNGERTHVMVVFPSRRFVRIGVPGEGLVELKIVSEMDVPVDVV